MPKKIIRDLSLAALAVVGIITIAYLGIKNATINLDPVVKNDLSQEDLTKLKVFYTEKLHPLKRPGSCNLRGHDILYMKIKSNENRYLLVVKIKTSTLFYA